MRGYTCDSCGSNLSHRKDSPFYLCTFCGKIYAEDMTEASLSTVRYLRINGRTREARSLITLLIEKDPDDYRYIWEMLNCSLPVYPVSKYLVSKSDSPAQLRNLLENTWYRKLRKVIPPENSSYIRDVEGYVDLSNRLNDLNGSINKNRSSEKIYSEVRKVDYSDLTDAETEQKKSLAAGIIYGYFFLAIIAAVILHIVAPGIQLPGIFFVSIIAGLITYYVVEHFTEKKRIADSHNKASRLKHQILNEMTDREKLQQEADELIGAIKETEKIFTGDIEQDQAMS